MTNCQRECSERPAVSLAQPVHAKTCLSSGKAAELWAGEGTDEYVSTTKDRPACTLARRSASARKREAAPAKAGNTAGGPYTFARACFFNILIITRTPC